MKRFLLSIIGILTFAIGMNAETYTHTFKDKELDENGGKASLSGIEWTSSKASITWNKEKGIQLGSKSAVCPSFSLTTSAFKDYTIKSVTVHSCIASSGDAKLTIKAGNATSGEYALTGTSTGYKFECKEQGDITISWSAKQRAYYVSKIEVEYELPSDMVDIEEPVFVTPIDVVYTNKVEITAETKDESLVLYYTIDGTEPSYEDYNSDPRVGTTKCSKGYQMNPILTDSITVNTIKAMAVKVDGESVYKSDIVETIYIVSTKKPYTLATTVANGNKYALFANDSIADALNPTITNGFLNDHKATKNEKCYEAAEYNAFTFTASNGGYTIQDANGRYMYVNGTSNEFFFAKEKPATGAVWNITFNNGKAEIKNGNSTIYYVADEGKFGCYTAATGNMVLPSLHMLREYPKATITPENNSTVKGLQEIVITCEEGIATSENFKLKAVGLAKKEGGYEIDKTYKCQQVNNNTLKFTIDTPIATEDNITLEIVIEGDIYLNPSDIKYPMPSISRYQHVISTYTHTGDAAPAEVLSVTPANGSKIEALKYILFTFSKIVNQSEDGAKTAKLYREGSSELIAIEVTSLKDGSDSDHVNQEQKAIKVSDPVIKNGTYILEIADGFFEDRNGNAVKGMTLKYIVENETGVKDIIADGETGWVVYNITGVKVMDTMNADELNTLPKGIYIINGKKAIVK